MNDKIQHGPADGPQEIPGHANLKARMDRAHEDANEADARKSLAERFPVPSPNAAFLFSPLRVVERDGIYSVVTREDETPGSKNNFELCVCQNQDEARLFAAAPLLYRELAALVGDFARSVQTKDPMLVRARAALDTALNGGA